MGSSKTSDGAVFYSHPEGRTEGGNPAVVGLPEWRGFVIGREASVVSGSASVVPGDAVIAVEAGASGIVADIAFTGLTNSAYGRDLGQHGLDGSVVEP